MSDKQQPDTGTQGAPARKSRGGLKFTHVIMLVFIAAAIGIMISATFNFSTYENFTTAANEPNKEVHVIGTLVRDAEMNYDPEVDPNYFTFYLADEEGTKRKVVFHGTKPQDFERSEQVVLVGKVVGDDFEASKILTKCPSKYVDDEIETREYNATPS